MKRLNLAERPPKFKRSGDGVATLRRHLQASGLVCGTVPEMYGAVEPPPKVSADGLYLAEQSDLPASLVPDAPHDACALLRGSPGDHIPVAGKFQKLDVETDGAQLSTWTFVVSIYDVTTSSVPSGAPTITNLRTGLQ